MSAGTTHPSDPAWRLLQAMPKAELHVHLDGCLRPVTALDLADDRGIDVPRSFVEMFHALVAPEKPGSQAALLRSFELPIALMQDADALTRITTDLIEDKSADRVRYLEIKWAPAVHRTKGLTLDEVIGTVSDAAEAAALRTGVVVRLTVVAMRSAEVDENIEVAAAAVRHRHRLVSGFDLAGFEEAHPDPLVHAAAFDLARAGGLGLTVHAGELIDGGALVRRALALRPHRIAHGASAAGDADVIRELIEQRVTLDLCPTSNVQAGTVETFSDHPLAQLLRAGVGVTINTDDTTISNIVLSEELHACHVRLGLTLAEIWRCNLHALEAAFVDETTRARLLGEFTSWGRGLAELHD